MKVGPYELLGELGRGGAGTVHRARGPGGDEVALKLLKAGASPAALARFERERRLLATLGEREGFVPLLDSGTEGVPWFAMPIVPGGTLRDRLSRGPLSLDDTLDLLVTVAVALASAHERGIVHRDLKPENILFRADGRPLVADCGLARHFDRSAPGASAASLSRTGELLGTIGYSAPEQLSSAKDAGPAADVFALGAILFEAVAGRPAFVGESVLEVVGRITEGRREPLPPDVPPRVARVIERALDPDPERRFPDAGAFASALAACDLEPARRPSAWSRIASVAGMATKRERAFFVQGKVFANLLFVHKFLAVAFTLAVPLAVAADQASGNTKHRGLQVLVPGALASWFFLAGLTLRRRLFLDLELVAVAGLVGLCAWAVATRDVPAATRAREVLGVLFFGVPVCLAYLLPEVRACVRQPSAGTLRDRLPDLYATLREVSLIALLVGTVLGALVGGTWWLVASR